MNVLIVAEKPSISRALAPVARRHWHAARITFVHAVPYTNIRFSYPRGLSLNDYPFVSEPGEKLAPFESWVCSPFVLAARGVSAPVAMTRELFTSADIIVSACDPDHTGSTAFAILLEQVFDDERALQCPALSLCALDEVSIEQAFAAISLFGPTFAKSLAYGRVKRYFDWNWNVNCLAVLGETQRRAGVPTDAPPLSKYALQLLYALHNEALPKAEGEVINRMHHWKGTGRYVSPRTSMGSAASRSRIIENLVDAGLLERVPGERFQCLVVSGRGRALLAGMHPDCEDLDLPFRLHAWCEQGPAAKPAIDRYIRTFFGKQKRFLAR